MIQKTIFLFVLLAITWPASPQNEKLTKDLDSFTEVKVFDGISVNLIKSNENKAVVSGANVNKVSIVNSNGILRIRMEVTRIFSGYRTFVDVYYSGKLVIIDVNEDARITAEDMIQQDVLELKAQEGGQLQIKAQVEQLLIKSVTGGIIKASGSSDLQDVVINTGGVYQGKDFKTKFSTVNVNAGSKAEIYAVDYVKATVKAGGEVIVHGDPAKMEEKTVFGGKITRM